MINPNDPSENEALAAQMHGGSGVPQRNNERPPPRARPPIDHGNVLVISSEAPKYFASTSTTPKSLTLFMALSKQMIYQPSAT